MGNVKLGIEVVMQGFVQWPPIVARMRAVLSHLRLAVPVLSAVYET